jgi:ankyrin repeat protein
MKRSGPPDSSKQDPKNQELVKAAFLCDFTRVRALLAEGADPDALDDDGRSPLFSAVLGNSVGVLALLLESGADPNLRDNDGWTPLHFAAQESLPEAARILLGRGADPNVQDNDGATPLWRAVQGARDRAELCNVLRQSGAKDDVPNNRGETPRDLAERLGFSLFTAN